MQKAQQTHYKMSKRLIQMKALSMIQIFHLFLAAMKYNVNFFTEKETPPQIK